MICKMCKGAGNANSNGDTGSAVILHQQCEGDCSCQHKVGKGHVQTKDKTKPSQSQQLM